MRTRQVVVLSRKKYSIKGLRTNHQYVSKCMSWPFKKYETHTHTSGLAPSDSNNRLNDSVSVELPQSLFFSLTFDRRDRPDTVDRRRHRHIDTHTHTRSGATDLRTIGWNRFHHLHLAAPTGHYCTLLLSVTPTFFFACIIRWLTLHLLMALTRVWRGKVKVTIGKLMANSNWKAMLYHKNT